MGMTNNLYNLALILLNGCIITTLLSAIYIIGIMKYTKKNRILIKELEKTELNNINHKENIWVNLKAINILYECLLPLFMLLC